MYMHEQTTTFKTENPFVMDFESPQDSGSSYVHPAVIHDVTTIPKKRFFRQLIDLPKDMLEMRVSQHSLQESVQDNGTSITQLGLRLDDLKRKISGLQEQIDNLTRRSSSYQDRVENLSYSVNPLMTQISELKSQNQQIHVLSKNLKVNRIIMGALIVSNLVLLGFVVVG